MENTSKYIKGIKEYLSGAAGRMLCPPEGDFKYSCLLPVASYSHQLWDWGSWTSNIAIRQIMTDCGRENELFEYEKGCRLNFFEFQKSDGRIPIVISSDERYSLEHLSPDGNISKPVIAQHIAFIMKYNDNAEWVKEIMPKLESFLTYYERNCRHESGLFFFNDDFAIGVDNDPCTFYRPTRSSASIFLNTLMYKEYEAMEYICQCLGDEDNKEKYLRKAESLKNAINKHCWDEKDGFYYSCDLNLLPIDEKRILHSGCPRHYSTLIQRIGVWSGFLPLWASIASDEQAERIVKENLLDERSFDAPYGVRTLSKYEKMYRIIGSGNPSCWHGPVWIISNYLVFRGLLNYGYTDYAEKLVDKTITLLGRDIENNGAFHEYYDPETGEGVYNRDFLSWNMLVANMIAWKEKRRVISEY